MSDIFPSKEDLLNEINMLKLQNSELKQQIILQKENSNAILNAIPSAVVIVDATDRENKLALQAKILSNVNDAIIVIDENNRFIYINKSFTKLFGWQEEDLIGRLYYDFINECVEKVCKENNILYTLIDKLKANRIVDENHFEKIKCFYKDGIQIIIDLYITKARDSKGKIIGYILSIKDVSESYIYELELKKSEERYRYLFNSIDEGLAIIEMLFDKSNNPVDFRFIELNPAYEKQTGTKIKDIVGKTATELKLDYEDVWYEIYGKVALTGKPIRFIRKSQAFSRWFNVYAFRIDLKNSNRIAVLFNDITEDVLHNQKIEEIIKMQDDLYVNVSHELKTPLNVIFSANQLMEIYLTCNTLEEKRDKLLDYNKSIKQNCYRLTRFINNIVDLSKSNSGLLLLDLNNVDIVEIVKRIIQSVSEYVKSKQLSMIFKTNVEEKIIACDPYKIERIMLNLISNAIKFSYPNSKIFITILSKVDTVEITVRDTGTGIEKQHIDNIFKRFYQENKSLSRNAEGSGIGLSLIKSLIELHGGNISVESEINKGSTFKFNLPAITTENHPDKKQLNSLDNKIESIKIEFSDIYD